MSSVSDRTGLEHTSEQQGFVVDGSVVGGDGDRKLGEHDVLLGRGLGTYNHVGNIKFRKLVNEHKMRYLNCSKVEKPKVARELVQLWRKLDPPGRFLQRSDDTKGAGWQEVGDKKAQEKASQCLRERTPDVLPYYQFLRASKKKKVEASNPVPPEPVRRENQFFDHNSEPNHNTATASILSRLQVLKQANLFSSQQVAQPVAPLRSDLFGFQQLLPAPSVILLQREAQKQVALRQLLLQQQQQRLASNVFPVESLLGWVRQPPPNARNGL